MRASAQCATQVLSSMAGERGPHARVGALWEGIAGNTRSSEESWWEGALSINYTEMFHCPPSHPEHSGSCPLQPGEEQLADHFPQVRGTEPSSPPGSLLPPGAVSIEHPFQVSKIF